MKRQMEMIAEKWKDIKGFEGFYQVSNIGRIKSIAARRCLFGKDIIIKREKIMQPFDNGNGYLMIHLKSNNSVTSVGVHRLVAEAFIENPDGLKEVNHIDYNRRNNISENLEWCSRKQNVNHSANRMKHSKDANLPKSGEKYIHNTPSGKFRVNMRKHKIDKTFNTLEEAVVFRDEIAKEHPEYYKEVR